MCIIFQWKECGPNSVHKSLFSNILLIIWRYITLHVPTATIKVVLNHTDVSSLYSMRRWKPVISPSFRCRERAILPELGILQERMASLWGHSACPVPSTKFYITALRKHPGYSKQEKPTIFQISYNCTTCILISIHFLSHIHIVRYFGSLNCFRRQVIRILFYLTGLTEWILPHFIPDDGSRSSLRNNFNMRAIRKVTSGELLTEQARRKIVIIIHKNYVHN
jgi:hypothetical protein